MEIKSLAQTEEDLRAKVDEEINAIRVNAEGKIKDMQAWLDKTLTERRALLDAAKMDVASLTAQSAYASVRDVSIRPPSHVQPAWGDKPVEVGVEVRSRDACIGEIARFGTQVKTGKYRVVMFIVPVPEST